MTNLPQSVLFVEGDNELKFINFLLRQLWNLPEAPLLREVIGSFAIEDKLTAYEISGIDKFEPYFKRSLPAHVYNAKKIALIVDADTRTPQETLEYMKSALDALKANILNLGDPDNLDIVLPTQVGVFSAGNPQIGVFVLPNNNNNGTLEHLCFDITHESDQERLSHTYNFYSSISDFPDLPAEIKLKMQVFLATKLDGRNKTTRGIGMAAQNGHWNFDHTNLTPLKNFLNDLRTHHA